MIIGSVDDSYETMDVNEYNECLSILKNTAEDDWFDLDDILD